MKVTLRELRGALAGVDVGLRTYDVFPSGAAQLPALVVGWPQLIDYTNSTLGGASVVRLPLTVVVALGASATQSQRKLDELIDGQLQTALDDLPAPVWRWVHVVRVEAFRTLTIGESTPAIAADFIVETLA